MTSVEKRMAIERKIVRFLIRTMKNNHWQAVAVDDGGDEDVKCKTEKDVMEAVFSVDESRIKFKHMMFPETTKKHVAVIVLGNDGYDCIADHSFNETDNFGKIMDDVICPYCEKLAE